MINKKLLLVMMFCCLSIFKSSNCMNRANENADLRAGGAVLAVGTWVAAAVIAYNLNNALLQNDFYREKFNPFAKKVYFFLAGTKIIQVALMVTLSVATIAAAANG